MGRSEPGGEKERELARMTTMVIAAGRREGRQANDWRTFNEKTIKQAKTGLFIQNLCETEHPGDYERAGIFILESRRDLGRLYEMASVRIEEHIFIATFALIKEPKVLIKRAYPDEEHTYQQLNERKRGSNYQIVCNYRVLTLQHLIFVKCN